MFRNNTCYTDNEDAGFNKEDEGFVISVKRVCLTDMANVFEILIQGGGWVRRMEFPPVTSARRTKLLEKLARVHVKKGEAQKLRLPFAYPSQWVDWSTEHSIRSSERRERILRVRLGPPGQLIRYRGVGWGGGVPSRGRSPYVSVQAPQKVYGIGADLIIRPDGTVGIGIERIIGCPFDRTSFQRRCPYPVRPFCCALEQRKEVAGSGEEGEGCCAGDELRSASHGERGSAYSQRGG